MIANVLGRWSFKPFSKALPHMDDTERAALDAGTVGFEGALFGGKPDFDRLLAMPPNRLTAEEQAGGRLSGLIEARHAGQIVSAPKNRRTDAYLIQYLFALTY